MVLFIGGFCYLLRRCLYSKVNKYIREIQIISLKSIKNVRKHFPVFTFKNANTEIVQRQKFKCLRHCSPSLTFYRVR